MAKAKPKPKKVVPINKVVTTKDKEREALENRAKKVIEELKGTHLRQDYIAVNMGVESASLSRFMNLKDGYVTTNMIDKADVFLKSLEEDAPAFPQVAKK
jgi:Trp operon repressor